MEKGETYTVSVQMTAVYEGRFTVDVAEGEGEAEARKKAETELAVGDPCGWDLTGRPTTEITEIEHDGSWENV